MIRNNNNKIGKDEESSRTEPHLAPKPTQNTSQQNNISKPDINTFSDSGTLDQLLASIKQSIAEIDKRLGQ